MSDAKGESGLTMTRQQLRIELDWMCDCGDPGAATRALLAILDLHPLHDAQNQRDYWDGLFGNDGGMGYLVAYFIDYLNLTDHGGTVGGAWLTKKGEAVRDALRREQELDDFETLTEGACIHGYSFEDGSAEADDHDCVAAPDPVKWDREGPRA